ncbi:hypothetical protein XBJ2_170019 [Xenorhabdus bovienii str. Jollieti]|uniref:Uncharacterized protein n=1 Tax=Xenorhabdus bovienii (strain SS-2004) TaxID=406818 RepID=D3UZA8_XENBS|nr:hypothetical protein XBJ1_0546 [Xenorhabdus bovienii SS-2004]CDH28227.1 hypothetical protein XBJ2_170019 [Xenorhabdus bovienii str. Jollieti]
MAGDCVCFQTFANGISNEAHYEIIGNHKNVISKYFGVLADVR